MKLLLLNGIILIRFMLMHKNIDFDYDGKNIFVRNKQTIVEKSTYVCVFSKYLKV